ncbi:hypothetical protein [Streptomyces radicis]|uniref:Transmembrane protein n=1 Tax=Streptomyces radicis TaxID=1750517 RepID=A0A3A9VS98_9ACTN|nr:hypothetical protein [Streptomyces radicis]RKN03649.1 hypothetical protein D7319_31025 [Streptomyces radicis]RKN13493.1 hypothetical protein D7318_31020 [Streptomyces radicis]
MQAENPTWGGHQDSIKRSVHLALWTLAWAATLALARFGPSVLWESQPVASWVAVAANLAVGVGWIVAHARYLRGIDELQRKIMQDALAVTLGVGWVGGFAYVVADGADLIAYAASTGVFPVLLGVIYMMAIVVGNLRYR